MRRRLLRLLMLSALRREGSDDGEGVSCRKDECVEDGQDCEVDELIGSERGGECMKNG